MAAEVVAPQPPPQGPTALARGTYLRKRPQGWVFRRAIPLDLQVRFGLREIVRSLAHLPQRQAAFESRALGFAVDRLIMQARNNPELSNDQLRGFADALHASKVEQLASVRGPLHSRGEKARDFYEDYRDVATSSIDAALRGRASFDEAEIVRLAQAANIPDDLAHSSMPLLQQIMARGTAAFCIHMAKDLRPSKPPRRSFLSRLFAAEDHGDARFEEAIEQFGRLGPLVGQSDRIRSDDTTVEDEDDHNSLYEDLPKGCPTIQSNSERPPTSSGKPLVDPRHDVKHPGNGDGPLVEAGPVADLSARPTDEGVEPSGSLLPEAVSETAQLRFSEVWGPFVEEKIRTGEWSSGRRPELAGTLRLVLRLLGDVSILTLSREQAKTFRSRFLRLPCNHKNMWCDRKTGQDRTYAELMAHLAELGCREGVQPVDPKTWNKHCGNISSCIEALKATNDAAKDIGNPFKALLIPIKRTSAEVRLERAMAPTGGLAALFGTEIWLGRKAVYHLRDAGPLIVRDSLYWIPLMEVCLGLRREEAAQLRVRHVTRKFHILGIDLFAMDLQVKSDEASRRWVPLSNALLQLGFIEVLVVGRGPDELLFPDLRSNNAHEAYGDSYGKRFLKFVKLVEIDFSPAAAASIAELNISETNRDLMIAEEARRLLKEFREKMSNHGIRHWFRTIAENTEGVKTLFVDEIMGHAGEQNSEGTRRYFKQAFVENLKYTIDLVPMPFDPIGLRQSAEGSERLHPWLIEARRQTSRTASQVKSAADRQTSGPNLALSAKQ